MSDRDTDFLNGIPELLVLRFLSRKPMYGYELVQSIRMSSDEEFQFGEGCIYPLLHRLKREKLLVSRRDFVAGRTRVVYGVTNAGRKRLAHRIDRWETVATIVNHVIDEVRNESKGLAG